MKVSELFDELKAMAPGFSPQNTGDRLIAGDGEREVKRAAVTMFATPALIRECRERGVDLLIVHEPVYYGLANGEEVTAIGREKKKLIEESGVAVLRFHDYAHAADPDLISQGMFRYMGLPGEQILDGQHGGEDAILLDQPMTAPELAALLEEKLHIEHVRIAGSMDKATRRVVCCFGARGEISKKFEEYDFILTGEVHEWSLSEIARDYAQMGYPKALLVLGHIESERAGMRYLADLLKDRHSDIEIFYLESGSVYSYADLSRIGRGKKA